MLDISLIYLDIFSIFMIFVVSVVVPYACPVFNTRLEYSELPLLS
jgi:hypothetical protein